MSNRRHTIEGQLRPDVDVEYSAEVRQQRYPAGPEVELSRDVLARVGLALQESGWPPVRHQADIYRLAVALHWYASGPRTSGAPRRSESL